MEGRETGLELIKGGEKPREAQINYSKQTGVFWRGHGQGNVTGCWALRRACDMMNTRYYTELMNY